MKLTSQLIIIIIAISTTCLILFGSYQYVSTRNELYSSINKQLENDIKFINASIIQPLYDFDDSTVKQILLAAMHNEYIVTVQLYDSEKSPPAFLYGYNTTAAKEIVEIADPTAKHQGMLREVDLIHEGSTIGRLEIVASDHIIQEQMRFVIISLLIEIFVLNLLLVLFLIIVFRSKLIKPIISLTTAAHQLSLGYLDSDIPQVSTRELAELGESIDILRQSILSKIATLEEKNIALFSSEKRLSTTLNSIGDAVIATDKNGKVALMNPVAEELTGFKDADANDQDLSTIFNIINAQTRELCSNPVADILNNNTPGLSRQTLLVSEGGNECSISINGAPIRDEYNIIIGIVLVFRDISKELQLEEQLRQSQKLEAVGQLAGGVAHDFNNVLGGIIGAAELLEMNLPAESPLRGYQKNILEAALRASDLTQKLLAFSRKNTPVSAQIDIHELWNEIDAILTKTVDRNIEIIYQRNATNSTISGDPSLLQSAFLNICINASHAMPNGGTLRISTLNKDLDNTDCEESIFEISPGTYLQISLSDTGGGINREHLARIFDPFFTTKELGEGTGLGLSSAYGTICQHSGSIEVDSLLGSGTEFAILLPCSTVTSTVEKKQEVIIHRGSGTILLVEDDEIVRATAIDMLQTLGYEVIVANDGKEAIELFRGNVDKIKLVLLDMIMPKMNGQECFSELQKIKPEVQVILCSGFAKEERIEQMRIDGLVGFLKKPYRVNEISEALHHALNRND